MISGLGKSFKLLDTDLYTGLAGWLSLISLANLLLLLSAVKSAASLKTGSWLGVGELADGVEGTAGGSTVTVVDGEENVAGVDAVGGDVVDDAMEKTRI